MVIIDSHNSSADTESSNSESSSRRLVTLQVIGSPELLTCTMHVRDLKVIFRRALNTWAGAPEYLHKLSDHIEKL